MSTRGGLLNVLLVEDSEDDRFFFEHAFKRADCAATNLFIAKDGIEAIEFLKQEAIDPSGPRFPHVLFLDLKMPECDGFDVLRWMKSQGLLPRVKVFILSGSSELQDVQMARELGAREYLVKPVKFQQLRQLLSCDDVPLGVANT